MNPVVATAIVIAMILAIILTSFVFFQRRLARYHIFTREQEFSEQSPSYKSPGWYRRRERRPGERGNPTQDIERGLEKGNRNDVDVTIKDRKLAREIAGMKKELAYDGEVDGIEAGEVFDISSPLPVIRLQRSELPVTPRKVRVKRDLAGIC